MGRYFTMESFPVDGTSMKRYLITRAKDPVFSVVIVTYAKVKLAQSELEALPFPGFILWSGWN